MMLAWMAYSTLAGALLVGAGAILEQFSPWLVNRRRFAWLAVIVASLFFILAATMSPARTAPAIQSVAEAQPLPRVSTPVVGNRNSMTATEASAPAPVPAPASMSLDIVLATLWLSGSALCLGVLLVSAWRVARMRRGWREGVVAGVPVLVSHDVGPAVIGLVHHGIVVPSWVETLGNDEQRTVMTHEREHVRAGDPLLLWGATLLVSLAPWNAALWYALRRLRHAIEIDCDARVLRSRPDTRAYCTLLLDVGERTLAGVAPVAALAEPATLLERRIDAMTAPVRARRGWMIGSTIAAALLVSAACFAPRPQVEPRARVMALVSELSSLLSRDSVQRSLTPTDRQRIARDLLPAADVADHEEYGQRVVQIAHEKFPQAFETRDDAAVVTVLFDAQGRTVASDARRLPLSAVFDLSNGATGKILGERNSMYLLSRIYEGELRLRKSGSQTSSETPHTLFLFGQLLKGEPVPAIIPEPTALGTGPTLPQVAFRTADSIARALYPSAYAPHDGIVLVGLIFSPQGKFVTAARRVVSHDDVFTTAGAGNTGEFSKDGTTLLSLVFTGVPKLLRHWSTTVHRTDIAPAIVWMILEPGEATPASRTDAPDLAPGSGAGASVHPIAHVTLSPMSPAGGKQTVLVYGTKTNAVELTMSEARVFMDTLRVELPFTTTLTLYPGAELHFVSADGSEFSLTAIVATQEATVTGHAAHMVLDAGAHLRTLPR